MKLQYSILGIVLSLVLMLTGCKKDDDDEVSGATGELHLSAEIKGMGPDEATTRFRAGQGVGVWLSAVKTDADLNSADVAQNLCFMQSAGGLVSDPATNWNRQPSLELYAYAPYDEKASENPAAYAFSIEPRQDSLALLPEKNEKNDLLYAKQTVKSSDETTTVSFDHLMSKVVLHIHSNSSTPGALADAKVIVGNVLLDASVDLGTGVVTAKGDKKQVTSAALENIPENYEVACEAILVPQTVTVGTQLLEITTTANYTYTWNTDKELVFEPGKQMTLDVLVKETECIVRLKEIADWRDNEKIIGEALEDLPTFKVFDFYNRHGIQGIVIDVDETGKHGWVVSLDEAELSWATESSFVSDRHPSAEDRNNAMANLNAVLAIDPDLEYYPALKWCNDKNVDGVTGWVLPAHNVLMKFGELIIGDKRWDEFNEAIQQAEVEEKNEIIGGKDYIYLSSTLSVSESVRVVKYNYAADYYGWGTHYEGSSAIIGQELVNRVRAFHEF